MTYCTTCGTPQQAGVRFCTRCGRQVSASLATASLASPDDGWGTGPPSQPSALRRRGAVLAALALLLGGGGVAAWVTLAHGVDPPALAGQPADQASTVAAAPALGDPPRSGSVSPDAASAPATTSAAALASPSRAPSPPAAPVGITVVLDSGHNGANASHPVQINRPVPTGRGGTKPCNTTGTSTKAGYPEHAFTWDVALRVRDGLTKRGVQVVLTRPDDGGVGPCVNDRAAIANRVSADALVSIHADGAAASGRGFHVVYSDPPLNPSQGPPSVGLAHALAGALRDGGFSTADYIGSGGLDARADLAGLNLARVPAALVECANMRNPKEAAVVSSPDGRARYAAAITEGILAWLAAR